MALRSLFLKLAEYVDIIGTDYLCKNSRMIGQRTMGILGARKWKRIYFLFPRISAVCISLLCYSTVSKLLPSIVRDTDNNILVQ